MLDCAHLSDLIVCLRYRLTNNMTTAMSKTSADHMKELAGCATKYLEQYECQTSAEHMKELEGCATELEILKSVMIYALESLEEEEMERINIIMSLEKRDIRRDINLVKRGCLLRYKPAFGAKIYNSIRPHPHMMQLNKKKWMWQVKTSHPHMMQPNKEKWMWQVKTST